MEMWFGRTPMMQKRTLRNGRPSTATVRFCLIGSDSEGSATWAEIKAELEVDIPGAPSTPLRGLFNGHKKMAPHVLPGTRLPVSLHPTDNQKLVIDWGRWERDGGLAAAKEQAGEGEAREANADAYGSGAAPGEQSAAAGAGAATGSSGGWQEQSIAAWRQAVASGHMSQAEFDRAMDDLRRASGG